MIIQSYKFKIDMKGTEKQADEGNPVMSRQFYQEMADAIKEKNTGSASSDVTPEKKSSRKAESSPGVSPAVHSSTSELTRKIGEIINQKADKTWRDGRGGQVDIVI